jgi:hypothetical protein
MSIMVGRVVDKVIVAVCSELVFRFHVTHPQWLGLEHSWGEKLFGWFSSGGLACRTFVSIRELVLVGNRWSV